MWMRKLMSWYARNDVTKNDDRILVVVIAVEGESKHNHIWKLIILMTYLPTRIVNITIQCCGETLNTARDLNTNIYCIYNYIGIVY